MASAEETLDDDAAQPADGGDEIAASEAAGEDTGQPSGDEAEVASVADTSTTSMVALERSQRTPLTKMLPKEEMEPWLMPVPLTPPLSARPPPPAEVGDAARYYQRLYERASDDLAVLCLIVQEATQNTVRQVATIKVGISSDKAKEINKLIKADAPKGVQSQTQGDTVRVTSKKRDHLQETMALLKGADLGIANARIIAAGSKERSVLWQRLRTTDGNRMPPLSTHLVDDDGVSLIGSWIDNL